MTFEQLEVSAPILKALQTQGYTQPTPIQEKAIPLVLQGNDLLACAQTGTGKTAAFSLPILQLLSEREVKGKPHIRALIVTPTRELAIQIEENVLAYGAHLNLSSAVIFGGVSQHSQVNQIKRGVDILIATPGRLLDLIAQGEIKLGQLEIFVLDEADRMLDMGFIHDVKRILKVIPEKRQSLFFSATMPTEIVKLAGTILHDPEKVEVTPVSSTAEIIEQAVFHVDKGKKNDLLLHVLEEDSIQAVLVFTRTKYGADKVARMLLKKGIRAAAIHGDKAQNARQRALQDFKSGTNRVLVATDIAARGIDVDELGYVINYEVPNVPETYVHRIGRTGRAGFSGKAFSFSDASELSYIKDIEKLIRQRIPVLSHPFPMENPVAVEPEKKTQKTPQRDHGRKDKPAGTSDKKKNKKRFWGKKKTNGGKTGE